MQPGQLAEQNSLFLSCHRHLPDRGEMMIPLIGFSDRALRENNPAPLGKSDIVICNISP